MYAAARRVQNWAALLQERLGLLGPRWVQQRRA